MMQSFYLPDFGEGLAEADIIEWYVKEGEHVTEDESLLSVETAKALVDVPAPVSGILKKIHVLGGTTVPTHSLLAEFEVASTASVTTPPSSVSASTLEKPSQSKMDDHAIEAEFQKNRTDTATVVGKMATAQGVSDDYFIVGRQREKQPELSPLSSPASRIPASNAPLSAPSIKSQFILPPENTYDTESIKGTRKIMAEAMRTSHAEVAQVTLFDEVNISNWYKKQDITSRVIAALCEAVKEVPRLNAWLNMETKELYIHHNLNLGLAVDTEDGLFVPVLDKINRCTYSGIRSKVDDAIEQIKTRTAPPELFKGATLSLSNFGAIAGRFATPMVVPPAVTILGVGRCFKAPEFFSTHRGKAKVREKIVLPVSLSFDHRAATGGEGARFLRCLISELERA